MGMQRTAQEISVGRFLRILFCFSMFSLLHKTAAAWTTLRMSTVQKHSMHRAVFSLIESRQQKLSYQLPYRQRNSCRRSVMSTVVCYHGEISSDTEAASSMENLYQEWTLEQDELLWRNRLETIPKIASMLGRGLRGTQQRLEKLTNVDSAAYQRLFTNDRNRDSEKDTEVIPKKAFVPSSQVLRRIQWDTQLSPKDFSLLHYDRVDDAVVETALDAPNTSIAGKSTSFVDALPEHRIVGIKYRERVVWDREARTESFFANGGIETVMAKYDEWKRNEDEKKELTRRRQAHVTNRVRSVLGEERFISLKECSNEMATALRTNPSLSMKLETEKYVRSALELFVQAREDSSSANKKVEKMPANDSEAIDALSELVAIFPDENLRSLILVELSISMRKATGAKIGRKAYHRELPHILESDLTETFVRGSGSGGQKVNKTSSRVFLVHEPTKLSVECQDTRSLQQNRKIARKRLREKLDNYLHGNQSKENIKNQIKSSKKQKQKARSRARQKRRQASKEEDSS